MVAMQLVVFDLKKSITENAKLRGQVRTGAKRRKPWTTAVAKLRAKVLGVALYRGTLGWTDLRRQRSTSLASSQGSVDAGEDSWQEDHGNDVVWYDITANKEDVRHCYERESEPLKCSSMALEMVQVYGKRHNRWEKSKEPRDNMEQSMCSIAKRSRNASRIECELMQFYKDVTAAFMATW